MPSCSAGSWVDGIDVLTLDGPALRQVRGGAVGMVFQNPLSALNPSHTVGAQIAEAVRLHRPISRQAARARALDLMREVGITDPEQRIDDHPHRFSGGQRQRVMIAIALAAEPRLLIADEPTTGLDPLVATQILALLARLRRTHEMGVLFVTHDFGVVRAHADSVHVLYAGRTVETAPSGPLFAHPRHPYTASLLSAVPVAGRRLLDRHPWSDARTGTPARPVAASRHAATGARPRARPPIRRSKPMASRARPACSR